VIALQEVNRFSEGTPHDQLHVFTQGWLKGQVTDHGNALRLMRFWGLVAPSGVLDREFVTRGANARKTADFDDLRSFLRARFTRAYESLADQRKQDFSASLLDRLGHHDWDPRVLESLPGISDECDAQTRDKRRQCIVAVSDVIRSCDDQHYLAAEADPKGSGPIAAPPGEEPKDGTPGTISGFPQVHCGRFNLRDENHNSVVGQIWFDVPKTSSWIEQLGLRLLDLADQLREQEEGRPM